MASTIQFKNNASGTLSAPITDVATSIILTAGHGAYFPSLSGSQYFYGTLKDSSNNLEIVKVTARTTDTLTVARGQEGTTARAYTTLDVFELRPTAAGLSAVLDEATHQVGYTTTATAAGTTTLTVSSDVHQYFTGSTTQTVVLPVTSTLSLGWSYEIVNESTGAVTVQSSGANTILILAAGTSATFTCILTSGTTAASWDAIYHGVVPASGKSLTVSNTLTLAGTDGTTMTFPGTSATIARTDAANTFTGTQTVQAAATQDAVAIAGRAGGTGSYVATITPTTLTASRTITLPDASITVARTDAAQTFTGDQSFTGDIILTGAGKGVIFEGTTADANETTLVAGEPTADRTITLPDSTTTLAGLATAQTFSVSQRGTQTTDNDLSFDLSATNNFKCTPTAGGALTFTNIASATGQSGTILLVNGSAYAITAAANTKVGSTCLATISATGTYLVGYYCDGTNVYVSNTGALA